jgi:alpha-D-ribose 1-methylphosphonate 5-triphosphate synthase subunit PhnH
MKIDQLQDAVRVRLTANGLNHGTQLKTKVAALIEFEFLAGIACAMEANGQTFPAGVQMLMMSGRSILTFKSQARATD